MKYQIEYWKVVVALLLLWFVWNIAGILLPFFLGFILAYMHLSWQRSLQPYIGQDLAAFSIVLVSMLMVSATLLGALPIIIEQTQELKKFWIDNQTTIYEYWNKYLQHIQELLDINLALNTEQMLQKIYEPSTRAATHFLHQSIAAMQYLSLLIITPFTFFYFLRDWEVIMSKIAPHMSKYRRLCQEIDRTLMAYLNGQFLICTIMAILYMSLLSLLGLKNALALGVYSGILCFIPYVGATIACSIALLTTVMQFANWYMMGAVLLIYAVGQFIESNILLPNIIGERLNIHPLWLIFALLSSGTIGGIGMMLISIPITAIITIVWKHWYAKAFNL